MLKRKILRVIEALAFCAVLGAMLLALTNIVERKVSTNKFEPLLDAPEQYDVLFIGDSHMVNGVFPMELWADYGIASYNVSSWGNTLPVSYWVMQHVLEYAQPELIVIGVKDADKPYKLTGSGSDVHTALDCFPLSMTKIRAIEDLMSDPNLTDDAGTPYTELKWEYYFTLGKYHTRWSELTRADFEPEYNKQKGAEMAINVAPPQDYELLYEFETMDETGDGFGYLRMMIDDCRRRGIDVLLVHLPYPATVQDQLAANTVANIAQQKEVDYIDFVNLDTVVDYETDSFDGFSHLNPSGARKVTDYLGQYITTHYDIADHRGDADYAAWNTMYDEYQRLKAGYVDMQTDLKNALMLLHDDHVGVCVRIDAYSPLYADDTLYYLMHNIAREHVFEADGFDKWSGGMLPLAGLDEADARGEAYFLMACGESGEFAECVGDGEARASLPFGDVVYTAQGDAYTLTIGENEVVRGTKIEGGYGVQTVMFNKETGEVLSVREF